MAERRPLSKKETAGCKLSEGLDMITDAAVFAISSTTTSTSTLTPRSSILPSISPIITAFWSSVQPTSVPSTSNFTTSITSSVNHDLNLMLTKDPSSLIDQNHDLNLMFSKDHHPLFYDHQGFPNIDHYPGFSIRMPPCHASSPLFLDPSPADCWPPIVDPYLTIHKQSLLSPAPEISDLADLDAVNFELGPISSMNHPRTSSSHDHIALKRASDVSFRPSLGTSSGADDDQGPEDKPLLSAGGSPISSQQLQTRSSAGVQAGLSADGPSSMSTSSSASEQLGDDSATHKLEADADENALTNEKANIVEAAAEEGRGEGEGDGDGAAAAGEQGKLVTEKRAKPRKKGQKRVREPRVAFLTKSEVEHLEDGYRWRKYGQKAVKNSPHPRSYYRCTNSKCSVKKRVERCSEDSSLVVTTYEGQHTHHSPAVLRGSLVDAPINNISNTTTLMPWQLPFIDPSILPPNFSTTTNSSIINTLIPRPLLPLQSPSIPTFGNAMARHQFQAHLIPRQFSNMQPMQINAADQNLTTLRSISRPVHAPPVDKGLLDDMLPACTRTKPSSSSS